MRKIYSLELLRKLHLARYVYFNEEYDEVYAWYGGNEIKIYEYTGEEVGHSNIIKNGTGEQYLQTDVITERDVHLSIDSIVVSLFDDTADDRNTVVNDQ
ncbi:MAG TPA: hypothetical protein DCS66_24330 [Flavobacteriaceae bacterium]|nr:hypothetical protein [Flavobacteriaceae bacterium]|tara:strand:+ start:194 stop:490 length:297 start_codon:yes stop_codon:yes gene_type:complete